MSRRPANTPRVNAWLEQLQTELEPRGSKVALARHLAEGDPEKTRQYQNQLSRWFRGEESPSAELLLAINEWRQMNR